ncbi:ALIX V-shaped domain binding to HIV-domain-containing protein [Cyathus striatus]|nr:ALIX V-shaped domain binding to HIV-domain-containing protein [Cyathus striatus]
MPNLLALPFKKTYPINIRDVARAYISERTDSHPDEFKQDIKQWQDLRKEATDEVVHINRIDAILRYHAQLISILAKLPIQLDIAYAPVFNASTVPITLKNLAFERAAVLFNLAALYSRLAGSADRSTLAGIKEAANRYQQSAGTFSYLSSTALPKLLAKMNNFKNAVIARIAVGVTSLYETAVKTIKEASPSIKHAFPSDWLPHMDAKSHHFFAVAQYRKAADDSEASRYGVELARYTKAQAEAKKAYDIARRGGIADTVVHDIKSLLDKLEKDIQRSERDNDLIYHQDVPAPSALQTFQPALLVSAAIPPGLTNPASVLGDLPSLFGELVGWGTREAINIYNSRKENLIKEKISGFSRELQDRADENLRKLNLPASLEALERPIGLPPSLLRKAEEVRLENGPAKIRASIDDLERLSQQDVAILDESLDILDSEASEDEAARKSTPLGRSPSHEANVELIEKSARYRSILEQAHGGDESIRQQWDDWEDNICALTLDEVDLESIVPTTTINASHTSAEGQQTLNHSRILRVKLEELDGLHRERDSLVRRAKQLASADDIRSRIVKVASGFERMTEVQPSMFEDVLDEELAKYDKFVQDLSEIEQKQNVILADIKGRNELFLKSRRDDPSIKERERALQSLDLTYFKYKEIVRNLEEGLKFYNDLAGILAGFKEVCKSWSHQRNQELHSTSNQAPASPGRALPSSIIGSRKPLPGKSFLGLPSITSDDWEDIPLPPGPRDNKS